MPKLKTSKGVKKRIKITGSGKLMHFRAGRRHLLTGKSSSKTRALRGSTEVASVNAAKIRRLLPYSS